MTEPIQEIPMNTKNRIILCKAAIKLLEDDPGDPRQPEALEHYRAQLAELERRDQADEQAEVDQPTPEGVVINMSPGQVGAKLTGFGG